MVVVQAACYFLSILCVNIIEVSQDQGLRCFVVIGCNIPVLASYDGCAGCDVRPIFSGGDDSQPMYYNRYGFYNPCMYSQPQGAYMSSTGSGTSGYCGPQYGPYYQQVSPGVMQYYPLEQDISLSGERKTMSKDSVQSAKSKSGALAKSGQMQTHKNAGDPAGHWGVYQAAANGAYYGSTMGYDCYIPQQYYPSMGGFQPAAPQEAGVHGNSIPPVPSSGPGRPHNFPRVHSSSNISARTFKGYSYSAKGGVGTNWRVKDVTKSQSKGDNLAGCVSSGDNIGSLAKLSSVKSKVLPVQEGRDVVNQASLGQDIGRSSVSRSDYNKDDFQVSYDAAKFFIIKSYSEDDVHKSIKYSVWSSTPNGNKRLDEAYRKAQEKQLESCTSCPVFFFFSVNCSGQFCGVAEMVGPVDFGKNMDFWLQGKWNGCLPVKWHIIKDIPNGHFRHIILSNNDNKPVTHSRDTQEVHFHQGLEMLKIFKFFPTRTSLLDDFTFYDNRQMLMQERKSRQQSRQQVGKQIKERAPEKGSIMENTPAESGRSSEKGSSVADGSSDAATENNVSSKHVERMSNGSILSQSQLKENGELESSFKPDSIVQRVAELNLIKQTEESSELQMCTVEDKADVQDSSADNKRASKSDSLADAGGRKQSEAPKPKSGDALSCVEENKPKIGNGEAVSVSPRKEDSTSRMVINYKKALLGNMQAKVIVLDQTIGA
ncbi:hypothetical protein KP509_19G077700 [Ceratopteris richardii]|uniref:YTH domain-containing protein n=1 Tax=Ceratopteris richardii TaxID=49495 RepID=A0A8T2SML0_CERRI|nr:hypothetical protein KP509_19G077700 [Ceratopteris richardii]